MELEACENVLTWHSTLLAKTGLYHLNHTELMGLDYVLPVGSPSSY